MSYRSDLEDIEVVLRRETDLAWGFANPAGGAIIWIPKSRCTFVGGDPPRNTGTLSAPAWLLKEKRLI